MAATTITIKKAGPSKKFPDKFGWILAEEGEEFWNVSLAHANEAKAHIGQKCQLHHFVNNKGYKEVNSVIFDPQPQQAAPTNGHANGSSPEKGGIFHDIIPLLAAGKTKRETLVILLNAHWVYENYKEALNNPEALAGADLEDTF